MADWLKERSTQLEAEGLLGDENVKKIMETMLNKLTYLLNGVWARHTTYQIPFSTGPPPLASTSWMEDLDCILNDDETWISMVSL
jgi:hypothetical protein